MGVVIYLLPNMYFLVLFSKINILLLKTKKKKNKIKEIQPIKKFQNFQVISLVV